MLRGIVKYYKKKGLYGFAEIHNGRKVFFRLAAGGQVLIQDGVVVVGTDWPQLKLPRPGDGLVLEVEQNEKGLTATCWGYTKAYDEALATLPEVRAVRVLTVRDGGRQMTFSPEPFWQGKDLRELDRLIGIRLRPSSRTGQSTKELRGSQMQADYRLERLVRGRWRRYETPPATMTDQTSAQDLVLAAA